MDSAPDTMINVGNWARKWASIAPEKTALISEGIPYSFRDVNRRINRLCRFFIDRGVRKGERVAVLLHNCRQYIEIFFAVSKIGAVLVPLNWRLAVPELEFIIKDSGAECIIFEDSFFDSAQKLHAAVPAPLSVCCASGERLPADHLPGWVVDYEKSLSRYTDEEPRIRWSAGNDDPHILMYTSGTTGLPKGAMLSHKKTFFNALNAGFYYDLTAQDIVIIGRPLFHSGGLIVEMAPVFYRGGTVIVQKRFRPGQILETIAKYGVTILELPATVYNFMLNECTLEDHDLRSLKGCYTGGERVPVSLLQAFADKGFPISQIYGLTEASTIFWLPMNYAVTKMGSVGKPVFHGEVRIVDEEGRVVPEGEIGEIIVKGPIVMNGYWKRQDLTDEVIRDGWLYTGDLAHTDKDGFVYIVDRKKDMFISGGENVYPAEIEKVLLNHPAIIDAAVVGVSDEKWGEVGKAFIVLKGGETVAPEEITLHLADKLARYKIPKHLEFAEKLPKTASGKVQRRLLKGT
jgi:fatty-acyl-CoA synthase